MKLKRLFTSTLLLSLTACTMVCLNGCQKGDLYDPEKNKTTLPSENEYFDFNLTEQLTLDLQYNIPGYKVSFAVFTEDPVEYTDGNRNIKEGVSPVFEAYTDDNCNYSGIITLPTTIKTVYIYSPYLFVPQCMEIEIAGGKIAYPAATTTQAMTKAGGNISFVKNGDIPYSVSGNLYSLCNWNKYGKLPYGYTAQVESLGKGQDIGSLFRRLQKKLGGIIDGLNHKKNNSNLVSSEKFTNISIAKTSASGTPVEGANIDLVFLNERAGYQSTLGYYYYKTADLNKGLDIKKLPKYVIFPNVSQIWDDPYTYQGKYSPSNAPLSKGLKVRLKYFGEDGKSAAQDQFPSGYTIGWFILPDAYQVSNNKINTNKNYYYSNASANQNGQSRCITVFDKQTQKMVVGFEDGDDNSYEDILFYVDADPIEAIVDPNDPNVPSIDDDDDPIVMPDKTNSCEGTLAFEDIWPSGGDYDMNDVIVEYKVEVTANVDNQIKKIVETFTPVHDGALYVNAFGYQVPDEFNKGNVTLGEGVETEAGQNLPTYIVFSNAKAAVQAGGSYTITREFGTHPLKYATTDAATIMAQYNPFILPQYEKGNQSRREVHLPKYKGTGFADESLAGTANDAYYVDRTGAYPFAIHLPIINFRPATEKIRIDSDDEYPAFRKWADSFGSEAQDWYLHDQKK